MILCPSNTEVSIAVITGYFDDSGTHAGSLVVVWAGFIAPKENWLVHEREWASILQSAQLSSFHMADCANMLREHARSIREPDPRRL